jgi:hypothetical protein
MPDYKSFVQDESRDVHDAYLLKHGHPPGPSDLYHNAWRRLQEGWTHNRIIDAILEIDPPDIPNPTQWQGNFLCIPGFEYAFMYPAWEERKRTAFRKVYGGQQNYLPLSPWAAYPGHGAYNFVSTPEIFLDLILELQYHHIKVCAFTLTNHWDGKHWSVDDAKRLLDKTVPIYKYAAASFCGGWEWSDIDDLADGDAALSIYKHIRSLVGDGRLIYHHDRPGWWSPAFQDTRNEWDWWKHRDAPDGLLYQARLYPDVAESHFWAYEYPYRGIVQGIKGRLQNHLNKQFVMFEHSRDLERHAQFVARARAEGVGWC